jgi:hypothetical protein
MKQIFFNAIAKFNLPYDELSEEQKEYLEEELNEVNDNAMGY